MKNKNKKRIPTWMRIIIGTILFSAFILISTYIFVYVKLNKVSHQENIEIVPPKEEYFETDVFDNTLNDNSDKIGISKKNDISDISDIKWPTDGDVLKENKTINILLIGQDRRPGEARARSDSMMIATINKKNQTIKITSLMRDLYVQIPGYSDNRINAAYSFGGMKLLDATIEKNLQVHIDGNIEVDFDKFQQAINMVGGIDIQVNTDEVAFLNRQGFTGLSEGLVHMDGSLALEYCRIRYVGNSDYERTERQKRVVTTVFNNIKGLGLPKILGLVDSIFPLVTTDLSNSQIINFATVVTIMGVDDIGTYRIPVNGAFTPRRIRGMSVLIPDLTANRIALKDIISRE